MEKKIKMSAVIGGMGALNALVGRRLTSWAQTRRVARFYACVAEELEAYTDEVRRLEAEFPDRKGEEYERRLAVLLEAEVELDAPTLGEADFADAADLPSPGDMFLLERMINFEDGGKTE